METEKLMDEIDLILQTSKASTISTSVSPTVSECMTFYIKDYALYTEAEKNSPIISGIEHKPLVHNALGGDGQGGNHLENVGEAEVVEEVGWSENDTLKEIK